MTSNLSKTWLGIEEALGGRPVLTGSVDDMRGALTGLQGALLPLTPKPDPSISRTEEEFETSDGQKLKIRIYSPKESKDGPLPIGLFFHGGGNCTFDLDSDERLAFDLASAGPAVIVQPEYRLAPEHKWPTMLNDAFDVYKWVISNIDRLHGDITKLFVSGSSAGGNIAAALSLKTRDEGSSQIRGQILIQPLLVYPPAAVSKEERDRLFSSLDRVGDSGVVIIPSSLDTFYKAYKPENETDFEYLNPILNKSHKSLPKTFLTANTEDILYDQPVRYKELLEASGVPVKLKIYEGLFHAWTTFPQLTEEFKILQQDLQSALSFVLS